MCIRDRWKAVEKTDIALLLCAGGGSAEETGEPDFTEELHWLEELKAKNIRTILLINKADIRKNICLIYTSNQFHLAFFRLIEIHHYIGTHPVPFILRTGRCV